MFLTLDVRHIEEVIKLTEENRQEFVVGDVLQFSDNYPSRLLVQGFVIPARMQLLEHSGNSVVLSHPNRMDQCEVNLLVNSAITCKRIN